MCDDQCSVLERILDESPLLGGREVLLARIDELQGVESCIRDGLERAQSSGDWGRFERYVFAATRHPSSEQAAVLCEVLALQTDEVNNEDIVEALAVIRDPSSVDCLVRTLHWEPAWDEFRQMAVKCVSALGAVGTHDAVEALRTVIATPEVSDRVRAAAARELAFR